MIPPRRSGDPFYLSPDVVAAPRQVADYSQRPELPIPTPDWWWGVAPGALVTAGNTAAPSVNTPGSATPATPATPSSPTSTSSSGCC